MSVTIVANYIIWEQIVSFTDGNSEQNSLHLSIWEQCFIYSWELGTMNFLFYTTVNLLLLPCKQPFLAVLVYRKTKTIKVDSRGTLLLKYANSQRDLKSVRATTWRKIQRAMKWNGSSLQNLVNLIALKGRKKQDKILTNVYELLISTVVPTAFLVLQNCESKEMGCCCGASVVSEQQHHQDLTRIYVKGSTNSRIHHFYQNALHLTRVHSATFFQSARHLLVWIPVRKV